MGKKAKKSSLSWPISEEPEVDVALKLIDLFTSPTVCLMVGKSKSTYYLHRDILTSRCPYFASSFHFYSANDSAQAEKICILDDYDYPDAFKIFIIYLYLSRYEVPSGSSLADTCILHAQVYVLAERLCMDDLKATALQKMSVTLGDRSWHRFSVDLEPVVIIKLLQTVYEGTRDDGRWTKSHVSEDEGLGGSQDGDLHAARMPEVVDENVPVYTEEASIAEEVPIREDLSVREEALGTEEVLVAENVADYIVTATPLEPEPQLAEDEAVDEGQDAMRRLLSHYTASKLKYLRLDAKFMAEVVKGGAIVADIITAIQ